MSPALPAGTVIGLVPAGLAVAVEAPRIEAASNTLVHMADPADPIVDGAGVLGAPVRSVFETDSIALRLIMPVSWAARSPSVVAWVQGTKW
jgi:hypothetical protein